MLFSVLTRKDKISRLNFYPPRSISWLRRGVGVRSLLGPVSLPRSLRPAPSLGPPTSTQAGLRRQISAGGALGARSPDPVQLSSLRQLGAQDPTGFQSPQALQTAGGQVPHTAARQTAAALRSQCGDWGDLHCGLSAWPGQRAALARAVEPSRTEPLACPPTPSTGLRPGEQEGSGVKAGVRLLPPSLPDYHHSPDRWPNRPLITTLAVSQ